MFRVSEKFLHQLLESINVRVKKCAVLMCKCMDKQHVKRDTTRAGLKQKAFGVYNERTQDQDGTPPVIRHLETDRHAGHHHQRVSQVS